MNIRILDPASRRETAWSGGKTTELYLFPADGSYAERRFAFRISSATVDLSESRFTKLDGVTRYLTPLSEGFYLKRGGSWQFLAKGSVLCFSGDEDILCRGSGRDLNLMLKGARGEMRILPAGDHALRVSVSLLSGGNERQRNGHPEGRLRRDHRRGIFDPARFRARRSLFRRRMKKAVRRAAFQYSESSSLRPSPCTSLSSASMRSESMQRLCTPFSS